MSEPNAPAAAEPATRPCPQCATPVVMPEGDQQGQLAGASVRCPACGALLVGGEGTFFGTGWRFAIAANVLFLVAAGLAVVVAINWLANKYFIRRDATFKKVYTLSETSKLLLQKLVDDKTKVQLYFLSGPSDEQTREVVEHTLKLLEEYSLQSERMVTYEERSLLGADPTPIYEVCDKTGVRPEDLEGNEILFYCDSTKKKKSVSFRELYEVDSFGSMGPSSSDTKYKFKGESVLTAGIQEVTEASKVLLYFVTGHGEYGLQDFDRFGLSSLDRLLKSKENYETKELNLAHGKVPEDAGAVVIVRPKTKFAPSEIDTLRKYLDEGGRLLVLLNSNRDQAESDRQEIDDLLVMLSTWGIEVGNDYVFEGDPSRRFVGFARTPTGEDIGQDTGPIVFNVVDYGYHEIVRKLRGIQTWFMVSRSVRRAAQVPEGITVTELARTSPESAAVSDTVRRGQPPPGSMRPGPISIAVSAEKQTSDEHPLKTRIVVVGDADSLTNAVFQQFGRNQLVTNSLRWLVGREHLISGIEPIETSDPKLNLTKEDEKRVASITIVAIPGTFVLLAIATWLMRRK